MLFLAPAPAAEAWLAHDAERHIGEPAVLFMKGFHFLQSLNLHVKSFDLLHQLHLIRSTMHIDPFQVLWQLNALVKGKIYLLV